MNTSNNEAFPCLRRMTSYSHQNVLEKHMELCENNEVSKVTFHHEQYLTFNRQHYKNRVPFSIYADFESYNILQASSVAQQNPFCYGLEIHSNYPHLFKS